MSHILQACAGSGDRGHLHKAGVSLCQGTGGWGWQPGHWARAHPTVSKAGLAAGMSQEPRAEGMTPARGGDGQAGARPGPVGVTKGRHSPEQWAARPTGWKLLHPHAPWLWNLGEMGQQRDKNPAVRGLFCISPGEEQCLCPHTQFCNVFLQHNREVWPLLRAEPEPAVQPLLSWDTWEDKKTEEFWTAQLCDFKRGQALMPNGRDLLNVNFVYLLCSSTAHPQGNKSHCSCSYKPASNWSRRFLPCREWCIHLPATQKSQSQLKKSGMQEIPSSAQGGFFSLRTETRVLWVDCWVFSTWAVTAASHDYDAISALIDLEERDKNLAFIQREVGKLQKQTS